jgi:hypothetical protein
MTFSKYSSLVMNLHLLNMWVFTNIWIRLVTCRCCISLAALKDMALFPASVCVLLLALLGRPKSWLFSSASYQSMSSCKLFLSPTGWLVLCLLLAGVSQRRSLVLIREVDTVAASCTVERHCVESNRVVVLVVVNSICPYSTSLVLLSWQHVRMRFSGWRPAGSSCQCCVPPSSACQ